MLVAVFGDAHAHGEALDAVIAAAELSGAEQLWSLGDMIGRGPDPEHVVTVTRERCRVALMGNHDYGATGSADPLRFGEPGSAAVRSIELARDRLAGPTSSGCARAGRPPAATACSAGTAARATRCTSSRRVECGRVPRRPARGAQPRRPHARRGRLAATPGGARRPGSFGTWRTTSPAGDGSSIRARSARRADAARLVERARRTSRRGRLWLLLDLGAGAATWRRAPYDPLPARARARRSARRRLTEEAADLLRIDAEGAQVSGGAPDASSRTPRRRRPPRSHDHRGPGPRVPASRKATLARVGYAPEQLGSRRAALHLRARAFERRPRLRSRAAADRSSARRMASRMCSPPTTPAPSEAASSPAYSGRGARQAPSAAAAPRPPARGSAVDGRRDRPSRARSPRSDKPSARPRETCPR